MSRETANRDVALNALAVLTGGITAAAFIGTGLMTGLAADYTAQKTQAKAMSKAAAVPLPAATEPQPVATPLPIRTVVTTRFVQGNAPVAKSRTITRASGSVSTVRSYRQPAAAPAPQRAPARAVAPAPSAAS
ncbi:MAG: hypothetical protein ACYDDU_12640 [Dermatophilaceae bacterium]